MINYKYKDDLTDLDDKEKLEIVKIEIENIININNLLQNTLQNYSDYENADSYLFASQIIENASWNIRKMFPY